MVNKFKICSDQSCTGCGACVVKCPKKCIKLKENFEGFLYPEIDYQSCVNCRSCQRICPNNKEIIKNNGEFYMAWHKDDSIRSQSSSGGFFSALAQLVLLRGGVVVGAYLDLETHDVRHIIIDEEKNLYKLRFSKYYQSIAHPVYNKVLEYLKEKRYVLFSGTACQIAAIKSLLGKDDDEYLITMDVLCHGVANKKVVNSYLKSKEKQYHKKIIGYQFRVKDNPGWCRGGGTRMKLLFNNGSYKIENKALDTYFVGYNNFAFLRESCYQCRYCGTKRITDFTVADFWGVTEERASKEDMKKGISAISVNTEKGKSILCDLNEYLIIEKISPEEVLPYNLSFVEHNPRPEIRDTFFQKLATEDFDKIIKDAFHKYYVKASIKNVIQSVIGEENVIKLAKIKNRNRNKIS